MSSSHVSEIFPLISSAFVQVTANAVLFESYTECTSMFHDPCPLIWPTQRKMNICTLVTRLTFSWHAALFRGQSIKSNQRLQKSFSLARSVSLVTFSLLLPWCPARPNAAHRGTHAHASVIVLLSAVSHYPNSHKRGPSFLWLQWKVEP